MLRRAQDTSPATPVHKADQARMSFDAYPSADSKHLAKSRSFAGLIVGAAWSNRPLLTLKPQHQSHLHMRTASPDRNTNTSALAEYYGRTGPTNISPERLARVVISPPKYMQQGVLLGHGHSPRQALAGVQPGITASELHLTIHVHQPVRASLHIRQPIIRPSYAALPMSRPPAAGVNFTQLFTRTHHPGSECSGIPAVAATKESPLTNGQHAATSLRPTGSVPVLPISDAALAPPTTTVSGLVSNLSFGHDNPDTRIPSRTMRFVDKPERESAVQSASKRSGSSTQSRAGSLVNMSSPIPNHLEKTQEHTSAEAHPFARGSIEIGSPNYWAQKNNKEGLMTMSYMSTPKSSENHWQPFSPEQQPAYKPITNRLIRGKPAAPVHQQPNKETNGSSPRNPDKQRPVIRLATNQVEEYFKTSNPVRSNLQALFRDSVTGPLKHTAPVGGGRHV